MIRSSKGVTVDSNVDSQEKSQTQHAVRSRRPMKNNQLQIPRQLDKGLEEPDIDQEEEPDNVQEKEPDSKRRRLEAVTQGDDKYHVERVTRR